MGFLKLDRCFCVLLLAVIAVTGCSESMSTPPLAPQSRARPIAVPLAAQDDSAPSWMSPEAAGDDLLYISNVQNVTVYSYPKGKHVGTLRGFYRPLGECSDSAGDVFIANQDTVVEYKHGGKKPIRTLTFSGYSSGSCASDPITGNLAVTWNQGLSPGYVAIYQHTSGSPTLYSDDDIQFNFCAYDDKGDLFVDGVTAQGDAFRFVELPSGGNTLTNISLNHNVGFGVAVQWDGKYVTVADNDVDDIYRFAISGSSGTLKRTVHLLGATKYGLYQTWIDGKKVVGSDILGNTVWYWRYPEGGTPIKSITNHVHAPLGATISKAPKN